MVNAYIVDKSKRTYEVEIIVTVDIMMLHKLQVFFIDLKWNNTAHHLIQTPFYKD